MTPTVRAAETRYCWFHPIRILHVFALCSFAFTQPLLMTLNGQSVYFQDQQIGWSEIGRFLLLLLIGLPFVFVVLDQIVMRLSCLIGGWGRDTILGILFGLTLLSILRKVVGHEWLAINGLSGILAFAIAFPGVILFLWGYRRAQWVRSWLAYGSIGLVLFPATFLWQFHQITQVQPTVAGGQPAGNPVPVVLVVFDEFSAVTLFNKDRQIDAQRFPNFGRLAGMSSWYRNATAVHPLTPLAVPSMLSGRFPAIDLEPLENQYPGNLFQLVHDSDSFEMAVFEPITRLCPNSLLTHAPMTKKTPQSSLAKSRDLIKIVAAVYPQLIFTKDIPIPFPEVPLTWTGFTGRVETVTEELFDVTEGLFNYTANRYRDQQLQHFLKCVKPSQKPRFCFLHAVIPHFPWCFLPTGEQYLNEAFAPMMPVWKAGSLGGNIQDDLAIELRNEYRYRLQLGYVDRFVGQLIYRLEETGLMDECLLIVTSDHGVCFQPGQSRRLPDKDNLGDIMSVPLFIKMPGQREARIDDRNVESIDLLPTIAEVLRLRLTEPIDGISVSREKRRPRKTLYYEQAMTVLEPDFPQRNVAVERALSLFAEGSLMEPPAGIASHPDWHGKSIDQFTINPHPIPVLLPDPVQSSVSTNPNIETKGVQNFVTGTIQSSDLMELPADMIVAVDGIIRDSGRTYWQDRTLQAFEFLLSGELIVGNNHNMQLFLVERADSSVRLRPFKIEYEGNKGPPQREF